MKMEFEASRNPHLIGIPVLLGSMAGVHDGLFLLDNNILGFIILRAESSCYEAYQVVFRTFTYYP